MTDDWLASRRRISAMSGNYFSSESSGKKEVKAKRAKARPLSHLGVYFQNQRSVNSCLGSTSCHAIRGKLSKYLGTENFRSQVKASFLAAEPEVSVGIVEGNLKSCNIQIYKHERNPDCKSKKTLS